jgi:hypothetical protein
MINARQHGTRRNDSSNEDDRCLSHVRTCASDNQMTVVEQMDRELDTDSERARERERETIIRDATRSFPLASMRFSDCLQVPRTTQIFFE